MNGWHVACDHTHAPSLRRSKLLLSIQRAVRIGGRAAPLLDIDVAPSTVARACCEKVRFAAGATRASAVAAGTAARGGLHCVGEDELQGGLGAATGMSTPTARIRIGQHMMCQFHVTMCVALPLLYDQRHILVQHTVGVQHAVRRSHPYGTVVLAGTGSLPSILRRCYGTVGTCGPVR